MSGFKDLLDSERGVFCMLVLIAATALCFAKIITGDSWMSFAKYLVVTLVASKTLTGGIDQFLGNTPQPTPTPKAG